jgi:hypothetical protein
MKNKLLNLLLFLFLLIITGCSDDGENSNDNKVKDIMKKIEIKDIQSSIERRDFSYSSNGIRTGELLTLKTDDGFIINDSIYNSFGNLTDYTITEKNSDNSIKSITNYSYNYDYANATVTIKKNSKLIYSIIFWKGEEIKNIKENKSEILMTYLKNIYDGYAFECNYLYTIEELTCNIKNMIKTALIYDENEKKDYKIEYFDRGKILRETRKDKRYDYKYESKTRVSKKEYDNFDGVIAENIYTLDIASNGVIEGVLLNNNYIWQKKILYNSSQVLTQETFTPTIQYLKNNYGSYKKDYNYTLGELKNITVNYSENLFNSEKGIYTLNSANQIIQYSLNSIIRNYFYNTNGTIYKYEIISTNPNITTDTLMINLSDL